MKRFFALAVLLAMLAGLAGCAGMDEKASVLVKGNLDTIYLGTADADYLEFTESTAEDCLQIYEEGLLSEAEIFCYYFSIEYPDEEILSEIAALYKDIYAKSKYTVEAASRLSDSSYLVSVEIYPIDIFEQALSAWDEGMSSFYESYAGVDVSRLSEEEYFAMDAAWARAIVSHMRAQLPSLSYKDSVKTDVTVSKGEDGLWSMEKESFYEVDGNIIYYPAD